MKEISFSIEGDPVGKGRPRFRRFGGTYTPDKTRRYENMVKDVYSTAASDSKRNRAIKRFGLIPPMKKPDADNIAKIVLYSLNGIAFEDDKQVVALHVIKIYGEHPKVDVLLRQLESLPNKKE